MEEIQMTDDDLARHVGAEAAKELTNALTRLRHCIGQLTDEQVWFRASPALNSIGNLMLHLSGNVRQWIVAGIGRAADVRDRPAEFAQRSLIPRQDLLARLDGVVKEAALVLGRASARDLVEIRRIQGYDVTGLAAIFDCVPHFRGHTQEIVYMTRQQLGDKYQSAWSPTTPEQGAPV
jgi:hypothetical protein